MASSRLKLLCSRHPLMLFWKRRAKPNLILAAVCIFLIVVLTAYLLPKSYARETFDGTGATRSRVCAAISPSHPYTSSNISHSKWRQLPTRHPPGTLIQLPSESPKPVSQIQFPFSHSTTTDTQKQRQAAVKAYLPTMLGIVQGEGLVTGRALTDIRRI